MTLQYRLLPSQRRKLLRELLQTKRGIRIIEAHNGLSALCATTSNVVDVDGNSTGFDGLWISSLTDSSAKGHPDTEVIDTSSRLQTINEILQVTNKPLIVDGDTGGDDTQFEYFVSKLESVGVSAVVIEDKVYPKRNSLESGVTQTLEDPHKFATKVNRAKQICLSDEFMIFCRIESFIAGLGVEDAIHRARIYIDSQADGILIHSKATKPDEIYQFISAYERLCANKGCYKPVICVPTTYNQVQDGELFNKGFNIVIYANHLLRASYRAMQHTCESILQHQRSKEILPDIASVKDIMQIVGFSDVKAKDKQYQNNDTPVILLAAGKPPGFVDTTYHELPVSELPIANKTLLNWQLATLQQAQLNNVTVISGYNREHLTLEKLHEIHNDQAEKTKSLYSLMLAKEKINHGKGFILIFGDIFFDSKLISNNLLKLEGDVTLLIDNTFNLLTRQKIKPSVDLVVIDDSQQIGYRKPNHITEKIVKIGGDIPMEKATHEFIGIAKFSAKGAAALLQAYEQLANHYKEDPVSLQQLDFCAVIQQLIHMGVWVTGFAINAGWSEVHNITDIAAIEKNINQAQQKIVSSV